MPHFEKVAKLPLENHLPLPKALLERSLQENGFIIK
jgi:hypothetical protein